MLRPISQSDNEESDDDADESSLSEAEPLGINASLSGMISSQPFFLNTGTAKQTLQGWKSELKDEVTSLIESNFP